MTAAEDEHAPRLLSVTQRRLLGEVLVAWGHLTQEQLQAALLEQARSKGRERLGRILLVEGVIDEKTLCAALGEVHGLTAVDLDEFTIDPQVARLLPFAVTDKFTILPIQQTDGRVTVAVADPVDVVAQDELRARLRGDRIDLVVAPASQIRARLEYVWGDQLHREAVARFMEDLPEEQAALPVDEPEASEAGAVEMVHHMLATAARRRASDIHVEPTHDNVRIRLRVDGVLHEALQLPKSSLASLVSRVKIISGLDVVERRLPQDGRTRVRIEGHPRDVRVSTLPTLHGEKLTLRLLPTQQALPTLAQIGLTEEQRQTLLAAMKRSQGFILVTGPTGAGKSSTLYSAVSEAVGDDRNVITLEDPVEVELAGVAQVQINEAIGLTFDKGLRSSLRQDPDVVMVGEVRDIETGQMAVRAALTGHLVISTLHTLDAPSAIIRLMEMGIPRYLVVHSISLVLAQRLVRRPCQSCARPVVPDAQTCERLRIPADLAVHMVEGVGCRACDGTGFRGRIGVFETLEITPAVRTVLLEQGNDEDKIRQAAYESGWRPLAERGVEMAAAGQTTIGEILRVLNVT